MNNYENFVNHINEKYNSRLLNNEDKLLQAFITYYGEEYRNLITESFYQIIFCWYISDFTSNIYKDYICKNITDNRVEYTKKILRILGYPIEYIKCHTTRGDISIKNRKILINSGSISDVKDQDNNQLDEILKYLFGQKEIFQFNYETNNLYNFFSLNKKKQTEMIKMIFNMNEITDGMIEKIKKAIEFMDSIKEKEKVEEKYVDFSLVNKYIKTREEKQKRKFSLEKLFSKKENYQPQNNKIIGSSDNILFSNQFKNLLNHLNNTVNIYPFKVTASPNCNIVVFPILHISDRAIIHEINHAIVNSVLATIEKDENKKMLVKSGLRIYSVSNEDPSDKILEELINDRSSVDITDIFHKLGGSIFDKDNYEITESESFYEKFFPLIESFYQKYKQLLKTSRITENKNILYSQLDKDSFLSFKKFVSETYQQIENELNKSSNPETILSNPNFITEEQIKYADELVSKMEKEPSQELSLEDYIKELEMQGKKVTLLNHEETEIIHSESSKRR